MNWKGFGCKQSRSNRGTIPTHIWSDCRKPRKPSASIPVEIRTGNLSNKILGRCWHIRIFYVQWHRKLIHRLTQNDVEDLLNLFKGNEFHCSVGSKTGGNMGIRLRVMSRSRMCQYASIFPYIERFRTQAISHTRYLYVSKYR
jgi:hypothetical protein